MKKLVSSAFDHRNGVNSQLRTCLQFYLQAESVLSTYVKVQIKIYVVKLVILAVHKPAINFVLQCRLIPSLDYVWAMAQYPITD